MWLKDNRPIRDKALTIEGQWKPSDYYLDQGHNSFFNFSAAFKHKPLNVKPDSFDQVSINGGLLRLKMPINSVIVLKSSK